MKSISPDDLKARQTRIEGTRVDTDRRLQEAILYICQQCEDDPDFGTVKLNKVLWHADFDAYVSRRKSITGVEYTKRKFGPAPYRLLPVKKELEDSDALVEVPAQRYGYSQKRMIARRDPDLSLFTAEDIAILSTTINRLKGRSAKTLSDESHGLIWETSVMDEPIPYEAAFLDDRPVTPYDRARAVELSAELGW